MRGSEVSTSGNWNSRKGTDCRKEGNREQSHTDIEGY